MVRIAVSVRQRGLPRRLSGQNWPVDDVTAERIARNQSVFREANENIDGAAAAAGLDGEAPFLCECPDKACTEIIRMDLAQYASVRAHPRRFFSIAAHEERCGGFEVAAVVERRPGYLVVEKLGVAGEIAEQEYES